MGAHFSPTLKVVIFGLRLEVGILIPFCDCVLSCFLFAVLTFDRNTQRTRLVLSVLIHFRSTSSFKN